MTIHQSLPPLIDASSVPSDAMVQLITPTGARRQNPVFDPWVASLTPDELRGLYEDMVVVRRTDAEATALQRQGELGLWPPVLGQEAAQIGSGRALRHDDFVFSSYREHGVAYCRGVKPAQVTPVWRGVAASGWNPYDVNMAAPQVIIGAQTLHAVGYAMGVQNDGDDAVAIAYFGDGATSEGDVNEAMVFAASFQAPVIFFCQNNQWAISEPVGLQAQRSIADRAPGFGIPSLRVDGNDVLAVMAATRVALDRARTGGGPTFIEAVTYRMGPHTTADDPTRYRPQGELEEWRAKDPIARFAAFLTEAGILDDAFAAAVAEKADAVAMELRTACIALRDPAALTVFDNVYAEPNSTIDRERDQYTRYLAMFDDGETDAATATAASGTASGAAAATAPGAAPATEGTDR
ncbi:MAG: pyruvate dehydrogenase (acetyl-transferring) E1 component subunit alpha [Leifsonia flava]|uniref:Pyruvate dehydrogenase (Acetyl-transferring) E1 component subunit alpha n=2 Tax=Orlajensenia leifsoniae TaxID=2561933 RepID=A0A4Y9R1Z9_9MICO|nr:pyruvate dehydrogenase (acetyl-transferring) E1 component subunit alpha [Leifsonia flava]TFV98731.1 pyruvate dehydrogenase (acetyl-transferring) E1 component subunit alpha [Leifsonia flava]